MQFRSQNGETVRIANTAGHVALVGSDWTPVHRSLEAQAYASGLISQNMTKDRAIKQVPESMIEGMSKVALEKEQVKKLIFKWYTNLADHRDKFKKNNEPSQTEITKALGFRTQAGYIAQMAHEVRQELNIPKGRLETDNPKVLQGQEGWEVD
jgi:hypothetical protein